LGLPIEVSVGSRGYGPDSNFRALGFFEGVFGGQSSAAMEPPRVARLSFQVGASADQKITVDFSDFGKEGPITSEVTGDVDEDLDNRTVRIHTREGANDVVEKLDSVLDKVNQQRAVMGAVMSRLEHVIDNLMNVSMNTEASRSQIRDADYAQASTDLARSMIMQQASMAVLAQANTSQQNVLKLLQ
jgi:flagellin